MTKPMRKPFKERTAAAETPEPGGDRDPVQHTGLGTLDMYADEAARFSKSTT